MMNPMDGLYKLQKKDIPRVGPILTDAFQNDPLWNKLFEGVPKIEQKYSAFFETPVRFCMKFGEAYATSENLEGIAAWVPGDQGDMTFWRMIRSGALKSAMKIGANLGRKMKQIMKSLPEDRKEHMGEAPYFYFLIIGVSSQFQGRGFGGTLIRALIEKSEGMGIPLYLETETEENVTMYERFGFSVVKEITLPVVNLPMWEMVRKPNIR
jgi:ribosomal protein S18 acetylase RimI-like enzyme